MPDDDDKPVAIVVASPPRHGKLEAARRALADFAAAQRRAGLGLIGSWGTPRWLVDEIAAREREEVRLRLGVGTRAHRDLELEIISAQLAALGRRSSRVGLAARFGAKILAALPFPLHPHDRI